MTPEPRSTSSARWRFALIALSMLAFASGVGWAIGKIRHGGIEATSTNHNPTTNTHAPISEDRGELVFGVYCASCHGPEGHGDGASAAALKPPPRDFAARPWRFEPTPDAIRKVTLDGIPNTGMASFRAALTPADLDAVVAYVHRLATAGPVVTKSTSEDERLLADAGFTNVLGTTPPPLVLHNGKEQTSKLRDFAGQLVLLHFWGTGCIHCLKEIPTLNRLEKQYPGRLKILHVCADEEDPVMAQKTLDRIDSGSMAWVEGNGLGLARYEVQALPAVWLIAPDGTAIGHASGAKDWTAEIQTKLIHRWLPPSK